MRGREWEGALVDAEGKRAGGSVDRWGEGSGRERLDEGKGVGGSVGR